jgi:hypothetical protein
VVHVTIHSYFFVAETCVIGVSRKYVLFCFVYFPLSNVENHCFREDSCQVGLLKVGEGFVEECGSMVQISLANS